jgi:hypothetical protein
VHALIPDNPSPWHSYYINQERAPPTIAKPTSVEKAMRFPPMLRGRQLHRGATSSRCAA